MVYISDDLKSLLEMKQILLDEQKRLIAILKDKNEDFYNWLVDKEVDLTNLKKYSAALAAAAVVAISTTHVKTRNMPVRSTPFIVGVVTREDLAGLDEDEKADLVWRNYGQAIVVTAAKYNIDPKLIFATIMLESGGDTNSIRYEPQINDASYGLGQILYGTALGLGYEGNPTGLQDPTTNIDLIGRYHRRNMDVYGNLSNEQLTIAYNTGSPYSYPLPGHIDKFRKWYTKVDRLI